MILFTISQGTYKIDVLQGAKPVLGSPFFCQSFDPSKVKLQELGPTTVSVHDHIALKGKIKRVIFLSIALLHISFVLKI